MGFAAHFLTSSSPLIPSAPFQWRFPSFSAKMLSILVWSTAILERRPSREWMLCFEQQVRENFDSFTGQELACVAWALRRFGYTGGC